MIGHPLQLSEKLKGGDGDIDSFLKTDEIASSRPYTSPLYPTNKKHFLVSFDVNRYHFLSIFSWI